VAKTGGDYLYIQDAIDSASLGEVIAILPGTYHGGLRIIKELHIIGIGRRDKIIIETSNENVVYFDAQQGTLKNLTFKLINSRHRIFAIELAGGELLLENSDLTSNVGTIIGISNNANPIIRNNTIHDAPQTGILVHSGGAGIIDGNEIYNNQLQGIVVSSNGNPFVTRNNIYNNKGIGIFVYKGGKGSYIGNYIHNNIPTNFHIAEDADVIEWGHAQEKSP
ncbi:MAG: right-handed parallel beta-helix repeat-containing protein, partial [Chloroflexota bacterium]